MAEIAEATPKLFISYSWTTPDHQQWVIKFAEELISQGVHVVLDVWDLQPGHDANAFMESMVTDPEVTKVLLVCDRVYSEKSNGRSGGAGTEAQIITPEIYAKKAQDKFVAVVTERDDEGKPYLPVYYRGRIFIDLTDPSAYSVEFDKIVRWAWGKQLHVRPELGAKPTFIGTDATRTKIPSSVEHRRVIEAARNGHRNLVPSTNEYLDLIAGNFEKFRIAVNEKNREAFDDVVVASIEEFDPYRKELIDVFGTLAQYAPDPEVVEAVQRFFEKLIPYVHQPEGPGSYTEWDVDNYRFIVNELFLYAISAFLKAEKFDAAAALIEGQYYWVSRYRSDSNIHNFTIFNHPTPSLDARNNRLKLGRRSIHSDLIKSRNSGTGIDFNVLLSADFILYLRSCKLREWGFWWPFATLYLDRHGGALEIFARARSTRYFERLRALLDVQTADELRQLASEIDADQNRQVRWGFNSVGARLLTGADSIATRP
jgi:hypothetical protein